MMTMMMMMMMVVVLPVRRFSSHLSFAALLSLGGGSGYVQFDCLTTLHKSTAPTLTDSDDVLLSDEDFPILLLSFVDLFCTHFQILLKSMRNNLVYIITFSIPEYACTPFFDASFICVFTIMRPTDATNNYSTYLWCSSIHHANN